MNESRSLEAAVASGVLASEEQHRALLQSIVEVARAIFNAKASSVFLLDEEAEELVFEAVAGEGAGTLLGRRMPSSAGFAGWVLVTRQPIVVEDVSEDPRHARGFAQETGYVPQGLMAVPLLHEDRALGVLQVLDRPQNAQFSLQEMDLLSLFANQAAIALELLQRARRARTVLYEEGREDLEAVSGLAAALDELEGADREAALRLLQALEDLLRR